MKKLAAIVGVIASVGFVNAASAASAPMADQLYSWTGFYVGGTAGGASTRGAVSLNTIDGVNRLYNQADVTPLNALGSPNITGSNFIIGGKIGYNRQWNTFVLGLEGDISSFRFDKTAITTGNPFAGFGTGFATFTSNLSTNWLATIRPRLGYAIGSTLFYGTAGLAFGKVSFSNIYFGFSPDGTGTEGEASAASQTKTGWAAGAGVDYALTKNWIVSAEYQHIDLGTISASGLVTTGNLNTATMNFSTSLKSDIVRAGVAYKF